MDNLTFLLIQIRKYWRPIQDIFIDDPYTGFRLGNFTDEESLSPAKVPNLKSIILFSSQE